MHDAIVIGGSFAGLSAAMYLARGRHDVVVLDTGLPRNRFSPSSHGFFTHDGSAPADMIRRARAQVTAYPTASVREAEAVDARATSEGFAVTLASGEALEARRLVLASGLRDVLPAIPGLEDRWGKSVIHCPYCHGYEYADRRLGLLYGGEHAIQHARLIANWGPTTLLLDRDEPLDDAAVDSLRRFGVSVEIGGIAALEGEGTSLRHALLDDGRSIPLDALYVAPRTEIRGGIAEALGCARRETPLGDILQVDDMFATSVPGVHAAGDIARVPAMAATAVADGAAAGAFISRSLIFADH